MWVLDEIEAIQNQIQITGKSWYKSEKRKCFLWFFMWNLASFVEYKWEWRMLSNIFKVFFVENDVYFYFYYFFYGST